MLQSRKEITESESFLSKKQVGRLRHYLMLIGVAAAAALLGTAAAPDPARPAQQVVRAERFELVGADGILRGAWWIDPKSGFNTLQLLDKTGKEDLIFLAVGPDGGSNLLVRAGRDKPAISLFARDDGELVIGLIGEHGDLRAEMNLTNEGKPMLTLLEEDRPKVLLLVDPSPAIALRGKNNEVVALMTEMEKARGLLILRNPQGKGEITIDPLLGIDDQSEKPLEEKAP